MEEADQLCDRVAIMDHGRILALDTPGRPEARPSAPAPIVTVTADRPTLERLGRRTSSRPSTGPPTPGSSTAPCCSRPSGTGLLPRIIDAAEQIGVAVTDLSVSEPTLETVFINLTGKDLRE